MEKARGKSKTKNAEASSIKLNDPFLVQIFRKNSSKTTSSRKKCAPISRLKKQPEDKSWLDIQMFQSEDEDGQASLGAQVNSAFFLTSKNEPNRSKWRFFKGPKPKRTLKSRIKRKVNLCRSTREGKGLIPKLIQMHKKEQKLKSRRLQTAKRVKLSGRDGESTPSKTRPGSRAQSHVKKRAKPKSKRKPTRRDYKSRVENASLDLPKTLRQAQSNFSIDFPRRQRPEASDNEWPRERSRQRESGSPCPESLGPSNGTTRPGKQSASTSLMHQPSNMASFCPEVIDERPSLESDRNTLGVSLESLRQEPEEEEVQGYFTEVPRGEGGRGPGEWSIPSFGNISEYISNWKSNVQVKSIEMENANLNKSNFA